MVGNDLPKCEANYLPLTPITFLQRAAAVFPERLSVIYGNQGYTWKQTLERCRRVASALSSLFIAPGDTVAVVAPNIPAMYELHFAVPILGAVLNTINYRLDSRTISVILAHSEAKAVFVDTEFLPLVYEALWIHFPTNLPKPFVVHIEDRLYEKFVEMTEGATAGKIGSYPTLFRNYEDLVRAGNPQFPIYTAKDEWDAISINYTSGTTAAPKGVVYHHRGAYLNSLASVLDFGMSRGAVYLWSLPMFHCNGWCYTWGMAAVAGTNVCLRYMTPKGVFDAIHEHGVTHLGGAPTVLTMLANAPEFGTKPLPHKVTVMTGAGPPAAIILSRVEGLGFTVIHGYGLTESYGPAVMNVWKEKWDALPSEERAQTMARQGVGSVTFPYVDVVNPETMIPVPCDGVTMGEVMLKGHAIMKGYLKDHKATAEAFKGGMFHTGDIGVMHEDGYLQLKDRSKDIIISGGENISSIEVESILFTHPQVYEAAVVARPDDFWGETPCAFIHLKSPGSEVEKSIIEWCRQNMPKYMIPRTVVFSELPKTSTGKVQKNVLREQTKKMGILLRSKL